MKWLPLLCLILVGCDEQPPPVIPPSKLTPEEKLQRFADSNDTPGRFQIVETHRGAFKIDTITGRTWSLSSVAGTDIIIWEEIRNPTLDVRPVTQ